MRLLNSTTLEFRDFIGSSIPPYAILSHTWGDEEVSFQDIQAPGLGQKMGYTKIKRCCEIAVEDGFEFVWIDTCCIDKTSSSELSEAINSMYSWYQRADVCYVYLVDLPSGMDLFDPKSAFSKSKWFTRGWTLQELIAPANVIFFDYDWWEVGTKTSLQSPISKITGIDVNVLSNGDWDLNAFSVAQKMSWAAERETSRPEDMAYCLLGIFDVHMPLLYGEGQRAFIRLQEGIMKVSNDNSLFAWRNEKKLLSPDRPSNEYTRLGLLAASPKAFFGCGAIIQSPKLMKTEFTSTNRGINLELPLAQLWPGIFLAILSCESVSDPGSLIGLHLQKAPRENDLFVRMWNIDPEFISVDRVATFERKHIFVAHDRRLRHTAEACMHVLVKISSSGDGIFWLHDTHLPNAISSDVLPTSKDLMFHAASPTNSMGFIGALEFRTVDSTKIFVILRIARNVLLVNSDILDPLETLEEVFNSYKQLRRRWVPQSDRMYFQFGINSFHMGIEVRRQVVTGKRTHILDVTGE
ncbi:uncharacterized protein BP5553_06633 [Venustampulla echinocandica]|uniref:Uncharacterized protein n=1 Tax=Venustampulla echinocandica TaxID=2656787 RepID=A0A370TKG9_9HELO|nr:uncharacterized protein BP5553_06633 [Venustampulla echinocandica]RDL36021.1 hypothetical protein BP5553_06633 [Venustampulla echinocandica]